MASGEPSNPIEKRIVVNGLPVHLVDMDSLLGTLQDMQDTSGSMPGAPPPLMARTVDAEAFHLDQDDLLGARHDVSRPVQLPDWVETAENPVVSEEDNGTGDEAGYETDGEGDIDDDADTTDAGVTAVASFAAPKVRGFNYPGKGRPRGSGLDVRESMHDILVILFSHQVEAALTLRDADDPRSQHLISVCLNSLQGCRRRYSRISDAVLFTKALTLRRSGSVGALFKFKDKGGRDNQARDNNLGVELFLSSDDQQTVCCSRADEDCVADGCSQKAVVLGALNQVSVCAGMTTTKVLGLLCEDLRVSALNQGIAVLYGPNLCVVRREGGSWPFAVVRRKRNGQWMCHACPQGPASCTHAAAAKDAFLHEQSEGSDAEDDIDNLGRGRQPRKRANYVHSTLPRPLVPSRQIFVGNAAVVRATEAGTSIVLPPPSHCRYCGGAPSGRFGVFSRPGVVEFGKASARTVVRSWWCRWCHRLSVTDGLELGLVICSQYAAYTEFFLFECNVNLCRNASSFTSMLNCGGRGTPVGRVVAPQLWTAHPRGPPQNIPIRARKGMTCPDLGEIGFGRGRGFSQVVFPAPLLLV